MRGRVTWLCCWLLTVAMTDGQQDLARFKAILGDNRIRSIEILSVSYARSPALGIPKTRIDNLADYKCKVEPTTEMLTSLVSALDTADVRDRSDPVSVYWGARFFDESGSRIFEIYTSSGSPGMPRAAGWIGDRLMDMSPSLVRWFEKWFSPDELAAMGCTRKPD